MAKNKIGIQVDDELHARIKSSAPLRGTNLEGAYDQALRSWLANAPVRISPYDARHKAIHDKLEAILTSGDDMVIRAVVPNIEVFFDRLSPGAPRGAARRKSG